jgi:hypothetical protein
VSYQLSYAARYQIWFALNLKREGGQPDASSHSMLCRELEPRRAGSVLCRWAAGGVASGVAGEGGATPSWCPFGSLPPHPLVVVTSARKSLHRQC